MAATERLLLVLVMIELAIEKKAVVAQANFTSGGYTTVYPKNGLYRFNSCGVSKPKRVKQQI
jgi:hypothetical protein